MNSEDGFDSYVIAKEIEVMGELYYFVYNERTNQVIGAWNSCGSELNRYLKRSEFIKEVEDEAKKFENNSL